MVLPKIIDNNRKQLVDVLQQLSCEYNHLSIATGYWDLPGTQLIFENIKKYQSIRLLIGQEPLIPRHKQRLGIINPQSDFPDKDISFDLTKLPQVDDYKQLISYLKGLIDTGRLEVKVYRNSFLHAKCYIFGTYKSHGAVGIIGSSNFTKAGLTSNLELNALENDYRIVKSKPENNTDDHGHLSWFDSVWNDKKSEDWNGEFKQILGNSPVGDLTFGAYDIYIKTLMEVFPDELIPKPELGQKAQDVLYSFQNRNAGILINKLEKKGAAILADSVGLGKTITAGAIIEHYRNKGATRIIVIAPSSLKQQWIDDLRNVFGLIEKDFTVVSQQDMNAMQDLSKSDSIKKVDLFIIDEAHNLRNASSARHECILKWLQNNPESRVLLLTATPINNSLNDLVNQIQLGLKGDLYSVAVGYKNPNNNRVEVMDFFEALGHIQKRSRSEPHFDWNSVKSTLVDGINEYLVRSTRQGVESEGGIILKDGSRQSFPKSIVKSVDYNFNFDIATKVSNIIENNIEVLENINPKCVNLKKITELTQRSCHPFDFKHKFVSEIMDTDTIPNVFQLVTLFGFTPYKSETYQHKIYQKTKEEISNLGMKGKKSQTTIMQLSIHNMLLITWLKRLESSVASLLQSIKTYEQRLQAYEEYLKDGFILSFKDIETVNQLYGEDVERAFYDYDKYKLRQETGDKYLKRIGVERKLADDRKYNIDAMFKDILRDKKIAQVLIDILELLVNVENDSKLQEFAKYLEGVLESRKYGTKVLVFSYFADTINHLRKNLPSLLNIDNFESRSEFISGRIKSVEKIARRFSPIAKKHKLEETEQPLDFLFSTDILSEGQNLQDAGILINYDLHWNPVRMIQRNGRINRLGSQHGEVLIANLKPESNIDLYLSLMKRLHKKINTIKHTVGLDQGVLSSDDVNPIEFVEDLRKLYSPDTSVATKILEDQMNDADILSWTNNHIHQLREFLSNADQTYINKIKNIPYGKWCYLPSKSTAENSKILSLQSLKGRTSITGKPIEKTFFIHTSIKGEYSSKIIEDLIALSYIQTTPADNERMADRMVVDRIKIKRRASNIARIHAEASDKIYQLKPRQIDALITVQPMFKDFPLRPLIEKSIKDSRSKRQFEKIVRLINSNVKMSGAVNATTITELNKLIEKLKSIENEETRIKSVEPVLHYAKK